MDRPETRYAKAPDGTSIAYQVVGDGPVDLVYASRIWSNVDPMWDLPEWIEALVLLIAFNAAAINADERRREHATMVAYGVRLRTLFRMTSIEGLLIGIVGTVIGLGLGTLVLRWLISGVAAQTVPDIGLVTLLSPSTILTALALGVLAVGMAPLLIARRMWRMDVPSTLRVLE